MKGRLIILALLAALVVGVTAAAGATIVGTHGNDRLQGTQRQDLAHDVGAIGREQLLSYLEHADFANKLVHKGQGLTVAVKVQSDDKPVFRGQESVVRGG